MTLKFPVIVGRDENHFPPLGNDICPMDGTPIEGEFVSLAGGAMVELYKDSYAAADFLAGYLMVDWHDDHGSDTSNGNQYAGAGAYLDIVNLSRGGQFHLVFCSTRCLRDFLTACVDQLEQSVRMRKTVEKRVATRLFNARTKAAKKKPGPKPKKKMGRPPKAKLVPLNEG